MRVGLLAFENKEDKEGCTEKGISEKKTSRRGGRELQNSILSTENSQCKGPEAGVSHLRKSQGAAESKGGRGR